MYPPRRLSSTLLLFMLLSVSQAGPVIQSSGGSPRTPITKRLGVDFVRATWWAAYHPNVTQTTLQYDKFNIISYFAARTNDSTSSVLLGDINLDPTRLPEFVKNAKDKNVTALATIGGWNGGNFSTLMRTPEDRDTFAGTVVNFAKTYGLDGIDIDWEYPGKDPGNGNAFHPDDTANLLEFLKALRNKTDEAFILTAATSTSPWVGADGNPSTNLSDFASVLDYIAIMNYDTNGQGFSKTVGPNAPLYSGCGGSGNLTSSAEGAVDAWNKAGFPLEQIVLGVPAYGHGFRVSRDAALLPNEQLAMNTTFSYDATSRVVGDSWDSPSAPGGTFSFLGLVNEMRWLKEGGTAASGMAYTFDACSQTPYIYDNATQVMVSYDDAASFEAKGRWIREKRLAGFEMFEAAGDYHDILLDGMNKGLNVNVNGTS